MKKPDELPEFYTGSPVDTVDLRFRDGFISELWETLSRGHVLLTAPRRTGKTSVMDFMRKNPKSDFQVVSINAQDLTHPADFFLTMIDAYHDKYPDFFRDKLAAGWQLTKNALSQVSDVEYAGFKLKLRESDPQWRDNWRRHGEEFLWQIRRNGSHTLLIIDELPDMVLNMKDEDPKLVRDFLAWFRIQRQDPHPKDDFVRWLVGGSVNLSSTLDSMMCVDLINDFDTVELPVLTEDQVEEFVRDMLTGRGVHFDADVPQGVRQELGRPIPLFMQMATQDLYRLWKSEKRKLSNEDVKAVFSRMVTRSAARDKLQHYYSRIRKYYQEPERSAAYELLSMLSLTDAGLGHSTLSQEFDRVLMDAGDDSPTHQRKQMFNRLLLDLENDFYVAQVSDGTHYDFASGILKRWWRKYYV